ncbi:MAG: hypothetical protein LBI69_03590 [Puniceicoccales bacterium]|jgi:hypothetical protein|nr:hypothetical protein [Puniceicoccales bacterium]
MKKIIAAFATVLAAITCDANAYDILQINLMSNIKFNSEHVIHGRREGRQNFQASVEVGADLGNVHAHAGISSLLFPMDDAVSLGVCGAVPVVSVEGPSSLPKEYVISANEIAPNIGLSCGLRNGVTLDIGYTAHLYTNLEEFSNSATTAGGYRIKKSSNEIYVDAAFEDAFLPILHISYDFDREELDINASAIYAHDFAHAGISRLAFEGSVKVGYDLARCPFGTEKLFNVNIFNLGEEGGSSVTEVNLSGHKSTKKGYIYANCAADIVYKCNAQAGIRLGIHFAANGASRTNWNNAPIVGGHRNLLWLSSGIEFKF